MRNGLYTANPLVWLRRGSLSFHTYSTAHIRLLELSNAMERKYRPLRPMPDSSDSAPGPSPELAISSSMFNKRKRIGVTVACSACRKRKSRVSPSLLSQLAFYVKGGLRTALSLTPLGVKTDGPQRHPSPRARKEEVQPSECTTTYLFGRVGCAPLIPAKNWAIPLQASLPTTSHKTNGYLSPPRCTIFPTLEPTQCCLC